MASGSGRGNGGLWKSIKPIPTFPPPRRRLAIYSSRKDKNPPARPSLRSGSFFNWKRLHLQTANPPRYLALDVGNRRIGVAASDELGLTAQPVLTIERRRNQRDDLRSIARLARRFGVSGIVVGNPQHLSGEVSPQAVKTRAFAAELGALTGLPIHLWDERLTTREAHQMLYQAGYARQTHRRIVDQVAATLILQSFMDGKSREKGTGTRD